MKPITIWKRKNDKVFEHNHIEDGHVTHGPKIAHVNMHKIWPRATWHFEHAYLTNDVPPKVVRN